MIRTWKTFNGSTLLRVDGPVNSDAENAIATMEFDGIDVGSEIVNFLGLVPFYKKIKWLHAPGAPSSEGLEELKCLERIVYISSIPQPSIDYCKLPRLKSFSCDCAGSISPENLNHSVIERLDLEGLKAKDLGFLSKAKNLKGLRMVKGALTSLEGGQNLSQLIELRLMHLKRLIDISALRDLPQIEALELGNTPNISDISAIYGLKNLRWLYISSNKAKQHDFTWISDMPKLECASIMIETEVVDWGIFAKHPRLYDIAFYSNNSFVPESDEKIIEKLSLYGRKVKSFKRFPKDVKPAFSIEFVPPSDISKPLPRHAYQNSLQLV